MTGPAGPRICVVTCGRWPEVSDTDRLAQAAVERRGAAVAARPWNGPGVAFDGFDAVILRTDWDFHDAPDAFAPWLERWAAALPALMAERGWATAVVKPLVSASGHDTLLVPCADAGAAAAARAAGRLRRPAIAQPFVQEIRTRGEWSLIAIDGAITHAARKRPAADDVRVQARFGGTSGAADPPEAVLAAGRRALALIPGPALYARIDGVETPRGFVLMAVEVNEPGLFFPLAPAAAERFAEAILRRVAAPAAAPTRSDAGRRGR